MSVTIISLRDGNWEHVVLINIFNSSAKKTKFVFRLQELLPCNSSTMFFDVGREHKPQFRIG